MWAVLSRHTLEIYTETIVRGLLVGCIKKTDPRNLHRDYYLRFSWGLCEEARPWKSTQRLLLEVIAFGPYEGDGPRKPTHRLEFWGLEAVY